MAGDSCRPRGSPHPLDYAEILLAELAALHFTVAGTRIDDPDSFPGYGTTGPDGKRLHTVAEIAQTVGVHRTTVYDYLKRGGLCGARWRPWRRSVWVGGLRRGRGRGRHRGPRGCPR